MLPIPHQYHQKNTFQEKRLLQDWENEHGAFGSWLDNKTNADEKGSGMPENFDSDDDWRGDVMDPRYIAYARKNADAKGSGVPSDLDEYDYRGDVMDPRYASISAEAKQSRLKLRQRIGASPLGHKSVSPPTPIESQEKTFTSKFEANRNRGDDLNFETTTVQDWRQNYAIPSDFYTQFKSNPTSFQHLKYDTYWDFTGIFFGHFSNKADPNKTMKDEKSHFEGANFEKTTLNKVNFTDAMLPNANFENAKVTESNFQEAILPNANFKETTLGGISFYKAKIQKSNFSLATIKTSSFGESKGKDANFSLATIKNVNFNNADLTRASFESSIFSDANFENANLTGVNFEGAQILGYDGVISFTGALLDDANFQSANITSADFNGALLSKGKKLPAGIPETKWKVVNEDRKSTIRLK